jgi:hypothetical protein
VTETPAAWRLCELANADEVVPASQPVCARESRGQVRRAVGGSIGS